MYEMEYDHLEILKRQCDDYENSHPLKIYYAHHIYKYGTLIEEYELKIISDHLPNYKIINPAKFKHKHHASEEVIMQRCFYEIDECDVLVFSDVSGVIGKGVYREIERARSKNQIVYRIHHHKLEVYTDIPKIIEEKDRHHRMFATV